MTDEQLSMPAGDWEPSDGQAAPHRPYDTPPKYPSAFGERCIECARPFVPVAEGQQRCPRHEIEHDTAQAHRHELTAGPDPAPSL